MIKAFEILVGTEGAEEMVPAPTVSPCPRHRQNRGLNPVWDS